LEVVYGVNPYHVDDMKEKRDPQLTKSKTMSDV
jgi:hypothetical protein